MKFHARLGVCLSSNVFIVLTLTIFLTHKFDERPLTPNGAHYTAVSLHALPSLPGVLEGRVQGKSGNLKMLKSLILDMKKNMSAARWHYLRGERPSTKDIRECADSLCYEYLSNEDQKSFAYCYKRASVKKVLETATCRFMNGTGRPPIALASFPGSGNTWVRGLLQRATGVCTGGIYCDKTLRVADHPGESIRSGAVLVVKTHDPLPRWTGGKYLRYHPYMDQYGKVENIPLFQSAILLIRNPFHALVSEWNRIGTEKELDSHTSHVGKEWFGNNSEWNEFVKVKGQEWRTMIESYTIHNSGHPVLVVKYEELKVNPLVGLKRMLDFLQQPYREQDLEQLVKAGYTVFYRTHHETFQHFTSEQSQFVLSEIRTAVDLLGRTGQLSKCDIRDYLNITMDVF